MEVENISIALRPKYEICFIASNQRGSGGGTFHSTNKKSKNAYYEEIILHTNI